MLDKRPLPGTDLPVGLEAQHETSSDAQTLPALGKGAVEEVEGAAEGIEDEGILVEPVDVAEKMKLDLIAAFPTKFPAGLARLDKNAGDGAYGGGLGGAESAFLQTLVLTSKPTGTDTWKPLTYLYLAVSALRMQEAQARNPIQMLKIGVYMPKQYMLTDKQFPIMNHGTSANTPKRQIEAGRQTRQTKQRRQWSWESLPWHRPHCSTG